MDTENMLKMFYGMMSNMSDQELEKTLQKAKSILNVKDYEKLCEIIRINRPRK